MITPDYELLFARLANGTLPVHVLDWIELQSTPGVACPVFLDDAIYDAVTHAGHFANEVLDMFEFNANLIQTLVDKVREERANANDWKALTFEAKATLERTVDLLKESVEQTKAANARCDQAIELAEKFRQMNTSRLFGGLFS